MTTFETMIIFYDDPLVSSTQSLAGLSVLNRRRWAGTFHPLSNPVPEREAGRGPQCEAGGASGSPRSQSCPKYYATI